MGLYGSHTIYLRKCWKELNKCHGERKVVCHTFFVGPRLRLVSVGQAAADGTDVTVEMDCLDMTHAHTLFATFITITRRGQIFGLC